MSAVPQCRIVTVHLFRGNRGALGQKVRKALDDEQYGRGPGPSLTECLLYAGHTGVTTDPNRAIIYGFNPFFGKTPLWQAMQRMRNGAAFPGNVTNDTLVFAEAQKRVLGY